MSDDLIDLSYEEALRICRAKGHDFVGGYDGVTGLEVLVCDRCNAVFREDPR